VRSVRRRVEGVGAQVVDLDAARARVVEHGRVLDLLEHRAVVEDRRPLARVDVADGRVLRADAPSSSKWIEPIELPTDSSPLGLGAMIDQAV
jgi:hypothetical protein